MDELGYESVLDEGTQTSTKIETFDSEVIPDMISTDVLHIRVSALDVRTYNGVKSGISKVLYTLPRFSNGSASGRLHITPHENSMTDRHHGRVLSRPYWPLSASATRL